MKILVSACLLGASCRYDGKSKTYVQIDALKQQHTLIPFCPEIYGGLSTPRPAAERFGAQVINALGVDVTAQYQKGADEALRLAQLLAVDCAVLKSKSPSCGLGQIYNGTFSKTLIEGDGVTAALLKEYFPIYTEENCDILLK